MLFSRGSRLFDASQWSKSRLGVVLFSRGSRPKRCTGIEVHSLGVVLFSRGSRLMLILSFHPHMSRSSAVFEGI